MSATNSQRTYDPNGPEGDRFMAWWDSQSSGMKNPASRPACWRGWCAALSDSVAPLNVPESLSGGKSEPLSAAAQARHGAAPTSTSAVCVGVAQVARVIRQVLANFKGDPVVTCDLRFTREVWQDVLCALDATPPKRAETFPPDEYHVFKDGNAWCAIGKGFINLQESKAGFGHTPLVALGELIVEEGA